MALKYLFFQPLGGLRFTYLTIQFMLEDMILLLNLNLLFQLKAGFFTKKEENE